MKEFFLKHKIAILRTAGSAMLIIGIAAYFWITPKEVASENEIAAANVARMEASIAGRPYAPATNPQSQASKFIEELKNAQKKQIEYMIILAIAFGTGFLAYSFISKKNEE